MAAELQARIVLPSARADAMTNSLILKFEQRDRLSDEEKRLLEGMPTLTKTFDRGEDLVREGDHPTDSKLLLEGFAVRYKLFRSGQRQITAIHVSGDFVDLHSFVLKPMDHAIVALSPCTVAAVPHQALREITERHPHLTRLFMLNIALDGAIHRQWLAMTGRALRDPADGSSRL
jgi:CRP-like cAMP-binding protein